MTATGASTQREAGEFSARAAHLAAFQQLQHHGQMHDAAAHLARALDLGAVVSLPFRGSQPVARILVLQSILGGNVLMHRFLDEQIFAVQVLLVEFWEPGMRLPEHDLVFQAVGDADVRQEALRQVERILAMTDAPVLNGPAAVRESARQRNADRLRLLPGVQTARTARATRGELSRSTVEEILEQNQLRFPVLLRAPGFHMGQNCLLLSSAESVAPALEQLPGDEFLLMEYLPVRSPDGWCRKYRVLFVDGQIHPVHLAISSHWKVHYFSAEMATHAAHRAEEARFLDSMEESLGSAVLSSLRRIQQMLQLDYAGVDFALDTGDPEMRTGDAPRLLLFEANATMAVVRPPAEPLWAYRQAAVERIYRAFQAMLLQRRRAGRCLRGAEVSLPVTL